MDIYFKLDTLIIIFPVFGPIKRKLFFLFIYLFCSLQKKIPNTMVNNVHAHLKEIDDHYSSYIIIDVFCFVTNINKSLCTRLLLHYLQMKIGITCGWTIFCPFLVRRWLVMEVGSVKEETNSWCVWECKTRKKRKNFSNIIIIIAIILSV